MARKVAATETSPRARRKASSSGVASRWISENATSPPSSVRPSRARPSLRLAGDRADAGDRHHAERDAGDEHVEAAQAAAHFAQRVTQRQ